MDRIFIMKAGEAAAWRSGKSALIWIERSSIASAERTLALFQPYEGDLEIVLSSEFGIHENLNRAE